MGRTESIAATVTAVGLAVVIGVWAINSTITLAQRINKLRKDPDVPATV